MKFILLVGVFALIVFPVLLVVCWAKQNTPRWPVEQSICLIVGGSTGIGLETAKALARKRVRRLVLAARREGQLEKAVEEVKAAAAKAESPTEVHYVVMDVSSQESVRDGIFAAERLCSHEPFDLVIYNAGFSIPKRFTQCDIDDATSMMEVNYYGCLRLVWALLPNMLVQRRGRVVLTSSMAARAPIAGYSLYAATKAALRAFAHSLDMENSCFGVRVQVVSPPDVVTPGYEKEELIKSPECRAISSFGGSKPFDAAAMGKAIVSGIEHYRFDITLGCDGALLSLGSACMEPSTSRCVLLEQVACGGLLRLGLAVFSKIHYRIVERIRLKEAEEKTKKVD